MPQDIVVITGASSGFGEMIAMELARSGCTVFASMRETTGRNKNKVDEYASAAARERIDLRSLEMDVGDQSSVDAAVQQVISQVGRIDVLIHNAGHMNLGPTEAFTVEQVAQLYDVNTLSTQRVNRAALPHMRSQAKALLIWISSSSVKGNWSPYLGPYFAAKAGMEQLAVSYAAELSRFGVESCIIAPGAFTTGTKHFEHAMKPADETCAMAYAGGPTANIESKVLEGTKSLEPEDADPMEVARAVVRVVQTPFGSRPFRVTIDPSQDGSEIVSAVQDRFRRETLRRVGLSDLLHPTQTNA